MLELNLKPLRSYVTAGMFALVAGAAVFPVNHAWAQVRTLPDFTDLVEQAGPSVVNIRTLEKAKAASATNGIDEQMQEFFKRFGIPVPPNMPRGPRAEPEQESQT